MGWLKDIFSGGAAKLVGTVGEVVDSWVTSDEERITLKNQLQKAIMDNARSQEDQALQYEAELTKRHENDMKSDSWLSKNVRPFILIFLTVTTMLLAFTTIFTLEQTETQLLEPWIDLLQLLLLTAYGFYFGSRGIEKVHKIKAGK